MASFRCYNNSDVIATLITTNFHLYLIHLWWQLFQMFVYGDVVYAQTWQVLTLKNCIEPFSYASTAYVVASALISVRLFWANGLPPPLAKNSPYAYGFQHRELNSHFKLRFCCCHCGCLSSPVMSWVHFLISGTVKASRRLNCTLLGLFTCNMYAYSCRVCSKEFFYCNYCF